MNKEISYLVSKVFRPIYLQLTENIYLTILGLFFFFIIVPPLITAGQDFVKSFPYLLVIKTLFNYYQKTFTIIDSFLLLLILLTLFWLSKLHNEYSKFKTIVEKFDGDLNSWNIPPNSQWTTERCSDVPGKMLCVTHSSLPGTLKAAYEWYDYVLSFSAKMTRDTAKIKQMIGIVVRSENNNNGIFLQFSKKDFRPHLLYNGKYYLDSKKIEPMKILLKENSWIKFQIFVEGDNIDIRIDDFKMYYRIPTYDFTVESNLLYENRRLQDLETSHTDLKEKIDIWLTISDQIFKETDKLKRDQLINDLKTHEIPQNTRLIFEYPRGSIGFREYGNERTFFRNVVLKKI